jgi:hypothetical protein
MKLSKYTEVIERKRGWKFYSISQTLWMSDDGQTIVTVRITNPAADNTDRSIS